jgi:hypothetical protein
MEEAQCRLRIAPDLTARHGHIHSILPRDFPNHISQPILEGLREQASHWPAITFG